MYIPARPDLVAAVAHLGAELALAHSKIAELNK